MATEKKSECQTGILWHNIPDEIVTEKLSTTIDGISTSQAQIRLDEFGKNVLPEVKKLSIYEIFFSQFKSPLIYVLIAAALLSLFLDHLKDAAFITAVILINAIIGTFQEYKAEQHAQALQKLFRITAVVKRDGKEISLPAEDLVPGDVILLEPGSKVPADLRLFQLSDCTIDESILTGESLPVTKKIGEIPAEVPVSDRTNMAFAGTTVIRGICRGYVTATGICTEVGRIAAAVADTSTSKPPLVIRMEAFSRSIAVAVLFATIVLGAISVYQGMPLIEVFFFAVALAVSAIPEGLPVALTVVLSIAASRMAARNVIIRKMTAVEGLGSCTLIASDKTGTLTVNEQTAHIIHFPNGDQLTVSGTGYIGEGTISGRSGSSLTINEEIRTHRLCLIATLCSEARLDFEQGEWKYAGDPIDVAFLALARKAGLNTEEIIRTVERPVFTPFDSERRFSAAGFNENGSIRFGIKGAAEAVLPHCVSVMTGDGTGPIDVESLLASAEQLAEEGYRVLAVAEALDPDSFERLHATELPPLTLLGFVGFIDPIRPDARDAVQACQIAGVRVVMVTGDHPATAFAIARELGIATDKKMVLTGSKLENLKSYEIPEFFDLVRDTTVFARVTPIQKLAIVDALIRMGHFVAVTGDGVNDAPALRRAHIGVAMGSGTDIAKDNAAMIITDDRFSSIVAGIEEGRYAYDNIRKVTYLLVSTGAAEVILFTCSVLFTLPLPLLAVQLLWLNLVTNGVQHVGLAFEPGEPGAMKRPPRPPEQGLFNRLMVSQTLLSASIMGLIGFVSWFLLLSWGYSEDSARNLAVLLFVLLENVHVFNCRSEYISAFGMSLRRNLILVCSVIAAQCLHLLAMYNPFMQDLLGLGPVTIQEWVSLLGVACIVILAMEIFKKVWSRIYPAVSE